MNKHEQGPQVVLEHTTEDHQHAVHVLASIG